MNLFDLALISGITLFIAFLIFSFRLKKNTVNKIALSICLLCLLSLLSSILLIGGWDGMAVAILTGYIFAGMFFGWLMSLIIFSIKDVS